MKVLKKTSASIVLSSMAFGATAGLIGDVVEFDRFYDGYSMDKYQSSIVGAGYEFQDYVIAPRWILNVDVEDTSINLDFEYNSYFNYGVTSTHNYRLWDLDFGAGESLIDVNVSFGNINGFDASNVTFGTDYIDIVVGGVQTNPSSFIYLDLVIAPVSEPGTFALLGLGLAGIGLSRRKNKA